MKALSKVIFALCISLFLMVPPAISQISGDPEVNQIIVAAKTYFGSAKNIKKYKLKKVTKKDKTHAMVEYAVVGAYGKGKGDLFLEKINGKWKVVDDEDLVP